MIQTTIEKSKLIFHIVEGTHADEETFDFLLCLPEKTFYRRSRTFHAHLSVANASYILGECPFSLPADIRLRLAGLVKDFVRPVDVVAHSDEYQFPAEPFRHQAIAFNHAMSSQVWALFMEMGTGKTKVAIDVADCRMEREEILFHFIVCPATVIDVWYDQYMEFSWLPNSPDLGDCWEPTVLIGSAKDRKRLLWRDETGPVFIINYEGLIVLQHELETFFNKFRGRFQLTLDESSAVKNMQAQRTKIMHRLAHLAKNRLILTGTPMTQNYLDLFGQFYFLDPNILGYETFTAFKARYAIYGGKDNHIVVGWSHLAELKKRVRAYSYTVRKEDCLDLPPKTYQVLKLDMGKEQRQIYNDMRDKFIVEIEEMGKITKATVNTVLTKMLRLQQITSGHIKDDEGNIKTFDSVKMKTLPGIIGDIVGYGSKAVIQCIFRHEITAIVKLLNDKGFKAVALDGSVPIKDRGKLIRQFHEDEELKVVVAQISLASLGIDLTPANYMIRFTHSYSLQDTLQFEDRVHRVGQGKNVTYIDLVCRGTTDVSVQNTLQRKFQMADFIMRQGTRGFTRFVKGEIDGEE